MLAHEHDLRLVAELSTAFHFHTDGPGTPAWVSPGFYTLTGASSRPVPSWRWTDAIDEADRPSFLERWHLAAGEDADLDAEARFMLRDGGRRWYRVRAVQTGRPSAAGQPRRRWVGACVDVRAPEDGDAAVERLLKTDFLSTVSHELRTPLNAVAGWLHVLQRRAGSHPDQLQALAAIARNLEAEKTLIDGLLDVSRLERGLVTMTPTLVDIGDLVRHATSAMSVAATARGVKLTVVLPDVRVAMSADRPKLELAVWHLLTNAVKFSEPASEVRISLSADGAVVRLLVENTGGGIDATLLGQLFEPFRQRRLASSRSGLGLGLTVVRLVVELHGGSVSATSHGLGCGSVFDVTLPQRS